ncbi:MAG: radical SAM protein [Negativicutes bacterium]|nr:radical SAM protein [Negativicutes bacterium]
MYLTDTVGAVIIYVTHDCNLRCSYCLNSFNGAKNEIDISDNPDYLQKIMAFINSLTEKIVHVVFFGGEPTLRWDTCKEMYDYISTHIDQSKDLRFIVQTNGTTIHQIIEDLKVMDNLKISISLDADQASHDLYRVYQGGAPSYHDIIENIKLLIKEGLADRFNIACCFYMKDSARLAERLIAVFELGVKKIRTSSIKEDDFRPEYLPPYVESMKKLARYLVEHPDKSYDKFGPFPVESREGFLRNYHDFRNNIGTDMCRAGVYRTFVNTNGDMYACPTLMQPSQKLGNLFTKERNLPLVQRLHRFYLANCDGCSLRGGCIMCMYKMYYDSGTMFICSDVMENSCRAKKESMAYFYELCRKLGYLNEE